MRDFRSWRRLATVLFALATAIALPTTGHAQRLRGEVPRGGVIYFVDQMVTEKLPNDVLKAMQSLATMEEIQALLNARSIRFRRETIAIDTGYVDERLVDLLEGLRPNEVFIARAPEGYSIGHVIEHRLTTPKY
jgi:hypothetical protein